MGRWCATCSKCLQNNIQEMMEKRNILTCWIGFRYKLQPRKVIVGKDVTTGKWSNRNAIVKAQCSSLIKQRQKWRVVWILLKPLTFFVNTETSSQLWLTMGCRWFWRTNAFGRSDIAHFLFEGALLRTILTWLKWKTNDKIGWARNVQKDVATQHELPCLRCSRFLVLCCAVFRFGK